MQNYNANDIPFHNLSNYSDCNRLRDSSRQTVVHRPTTAHKTIPSGQLTKTQKHIKAVVLIGWRVRRDSQISSWIESNGLNDMCRVVGTTWL